MLYQRHTRGGGAYAYIDDGLIAGWRGVGAEVREWFDGPGEPTLDVVLDAFGPTVFLGNLQSVRREPARWTGPRTRDALRAYRERSGLLTALRSDPTNMRAWSAGAGIDFERYPDRGVRSYYLQPDRPAGDEAEVVESGLVDLVRTPHATASIPVLYRNLLDAGLPVVEEAFGADVGRYRPVAERKSIDVLYVGGCWAFKWANMEGYVRALREAFGDGFRLYGRGWPEGLSSGVLDERHYCRTVCSARVNLALHEPTQVNRPAFAGNERAYKLGALGAAMVSDDNALLGEHFAAGVELELARDPGEMVERCRALLARPERAESMGRSARERVLRDHTYARRAEQVLGALARLDGACGPGRTNEECAA